MRHTHLFATCRLIVLALVTAVALAFLSVYVKRTGPELAQYGNVCGPGAADPCYRPALKGGFPLAYLFDAPGISVEGQLAFIEYELVAGALLLDVGIYFAIVLAASVVVARRSRTP